MTHQAFPHRYHQCSEKPKATLSQVQTFHSQIGPSARDVFHWAHDPETYEDSLQDTVRSFWREETRDALIKDPIHHGTWSFRLFLIEPTSELDRQTCMITVCTPHVLDKFLWPWLILTQSLDGVARDFNVFMQHTQARTFALEQLLPRLVHEVVRTCHDGGGGGDTFKVRRMWWDDVGKRLNPAEENPLAAITPTSVVTTTEGRY